MITGMDIHTGHITNLPYGNHSSVRVMGGSGDQRSGQRQVDAFNGCHSTAASSDYTARGDLESLIWKRQKD